MGGVEPNGEIKRASQGYIILSASDMSDVEHHLRKVSVEPVSVVRDGGKLANKSKEKGEMK